MEVAYYHPDDIEMPSRCWYRLTGTTIFKTNSFYH